MLDLLTNTLMGVKSSSSNVEPSWDYTIDDEISFKKFIKKIIQAWRFARKQGNTLKIHINQMED